jgi:hypothetical protein
MAGGYALSHLAASALALLLAAGTPGEYADVPFLVLGFPLMYMGWLLGDLALAWTPSAGLLLGLVLLVANSYLWGHALAWAQRLIGKHLERPTAGSQPPG